MSDHSSIGAAIASARRKAVPISWTAAMKDDFLDHLAATCNVSAAAAHVGKDCTAVYRLRRRDKRFAARWITAIQSGYEILETQLIGHALAGGGPKLTNGAVTITGPIDVNLALSLLSHHRGRATGVPIGSKPVRRATAEETDAAILRKLAAMKRGDARARAARKVGAAKAGERTCNEPTGDGQ